MLETYTVGSLQESKKQSKTINRQLKKPLNFQFLELGKMVSVSLGALQKEMKSLLKKNMKLRENL